MHPHQRYLEQITGAPADTEFTTVHWLEGKGIVTWGPDDDRQEHLLTKAQTTRLNGDPEQEWLDDQPEPV